MLFLSPEIVKLPNDICDNLCSDTKNLLRIMQNGTDFLKEPIVCCCTVEEYSSLLGGEYSSPFFVRSLCRFPEILTGIPFLQKSEETGDWDDVFTMLRNWSEYAARQIRSVRFGDGRTIFLEKMEVYKKHLSSAGFVSEQEIENNRNVLSLLSGLLPTQAASGEKCPFCGKIMRIDAEGRHYVCDSCGMRGPRIVQEEPQNCPYCGTTPQVIRNPDGWYQVACDSCGMLGPRDRNKNTAVKNWNSVAASWK